MARIVDDRVAENERAFAQRDDRRQRRSAMRSRVKMSQVWRRKRDRREFVVVQVHHLDRVAEVRAVDDGERMFVGYTDLRTKWRLVA